MGFAKLLILLENLALDFFPKICHYMNMLIDEVDMETYKERIGRYRIVYHEELPEEYKAEYRLNGIDPDARRVLEWSFDNIKDADEMLTECILNNASRFKTYYLVDAGKEEIVERAAWL